MKAFDDLKEIFVDNYLLEVLGKNPFTNEGNYKDNIFSAIYNDLKDIIVDGKEIRKEHKEEYNFIIKKLTTAYPLLLVGIDEYALRAIVYENWREIVLKLIKKTLRYKDRNFAFKLHELAKDYE